MGHVFAIAFSLSLGLLVSAPAESPSASDAVTILHDLKLREEPLGALAAQYGDAVEVRRFGDRVARDLRFVDRDVVRYAKGRGLDLGTLRGDEDARGIDTANGVELDRAFIADVIMSDREAIAELAALAPTIEDLPVKQLVTHAIPILTQHLAIARALEDRAFK